MTIANRVYVSTISTGTGTVTPGAKVSNAFTSFATANAGSPLANGDYTYELNEGLDFEIGTGTWNGSTLTRNTVYISSIAGVIGTTKMTLAGSATIQVVAPAEALVIKDANGFVAIGANVAANYFLSINQNTVALPTYASGTGFQMGGADGASNFFNMAAFGATPANGIRGSAYGNTAASITATPAGSTLISIGGTGYTNAIAPGSAALISLVANTLWSATNSDAYISFGTTPTGSLTRAERMRIDQSGFVGIGTYVVSPDSLLTLNANTGASVAPSTGTLLHLVGADSTNARMELEAYTGVSQVVGKRANGTQAAKTAASAANNLLSIQGAGWDTAAYSTVGQITIAPRETMSPTARGGSIGFLTVHLTTTTLVEAVRIQPSGGMSIGAAAIAADPGIGSLNMTGALAAAGTITGGSFVQGAVSGSFVAGSIGYHDANWGNLSKALNAGSAASWGWQNAAGTPLMTITDAGVVAIPATTPSTLPTNGALTVAGGLGAVGDINWGGAAWITTFTPTVTSGTGTITTVGSATCRYKQLGKTVVFTITFFITTIGSAGQDLRVTLPFTATADNYLLSAKDLSGGSALQAIGGGGTPTLAIITTPAGGFPGFSGRYYCVAGQYETT